MSSKLFTYLSKPVLSLPTQWRVSSLIYISHDQTYCTKIKKEKNLFQVLCDDPGSIS